MINIINIMIQDLVSDSLRGDSWTAGRGRGEAAGLGVKNCGEGTMLGVLTCEEEAAGLGVKNCGEAIRLGVLTCGGVPLARFSLGFS